jgi:serine protease Do
MANVPQRVVTALGLTEPHGVFVQDVEPGSPADNAGFLPYDVIVMLEGERVEEAKDYLARLYDFRPGDRLRVVVLREGQEVELAMLIGRQEG